MEKRIQKRKTEEISGVRKNLYAFQSEALDKIENYQNAALFWQMGAGKTISSIELTERWNSLILVCVVLKSTVNQWIEELSNQTDRYIFNAYKKSKADGIQPFIDYDGRKCIVIGYDAYKAKCGIVLRKYLSQHSSETTLICDESSQIGNLESERTRAVMDTKTKHKLLLSGTPASGGRLEAMVPTMHMLGWNISKWQFMQEFCEVYQWRNPAQPWMSMPIIKGYKNIDKLRIGLQEHGGSFITMSEAGVQLPKIIEQKLVVSPPAEYKKFMKDRIVEIDGQEIVGDNNLTKMLRARQICAVYNLDKVAALEELLQQTGDEIAVVFYNWETEFKILQRICEHLGKPISVVNGRKKDLKAYEADRKGSVILIQYQAGSMGLNLQKSRICIFYSLCLSYSDYEQAKARVYRIGQKRNCIFYNIICKDSVEEHILGTLEKRRNYTEQLFTDKYGEVDNRIDGDNVESQR